jgi:hypothetical protein
VLVMKVTQSRIRSSQIGTQTITLILTIHVALAVLPYA